MGVKKLAAWGLGGLLVLGTIAGAGLWGGYALNEALENRFSFPSQVHYKLRGYYNSYFKTEAVEAERLITNRLILTQETVFLPLESSDFAGGIDALPSGDVLVTDRLGHLSVVSGGVTTALAVSAPDNHATQLQAALDAGKLGAVEVDFNWFRYNDILYLEDAGKSYLLLSYTDWLDDQLCFGSALARLDLPGADPADWQAGADDWQVVARTEPCLKPFTSGKAIYGLEAGGRMVVQEGTKIVWTSGSYERDDRVKGLDFTQSLAQMDDNDYGKVMVIDIATGAKETLAKGLRNPQGVTIDAAGQIWVSDHGMQGGDELNLIQQGANYGFPVVSYGTKYNRQPAGNQDTHKNHDGFDKPAVAFVPSIAPASALALRDFYYAWDGDVLIGALSGAVHRVHMEDGRAMYVEPIELGMRIRDMARVGPGRIVLYTDDRRLIFLSPDASGDPMVKFSLLLKTEAPTPEARDAVDSTMTACMQCHGLLQGAPETSGPSLYGICGAKPGSGTYDSYSGALAQVGAAWTQDNLARYIADPQSMAPGTTMGWSGMEDTAAAATLASILCKL